MTQILRISPSQLESWNCRERWRLSYLQQVETPPNIFYAFGSCIHRMAYGYWNGWDYQKAYSFALQPAITDKPQHYWIETFSADADTQVVRPLEIISKGAYVDIRKLSAKMIEKWNTRLDNLAKMTSCYFNHHENAQAIRPLMNEQMIEWPWGEYAGYEIRCCGIIDRFRNGVLTDTKTCTAYDRNWKNSVKWDNVRKTQLGFYRRYLTEWAHIKIDHVEVEAVVQPYKGTDPQIAHIDITKELALGESRFNQQMDWMIREIATFCREAQDASPWPMNRECCTSKYGECDYLPVCDLRVPA